jgi:hypothetical protein
VLLKWLWPALILKRVTEGAFTPAFTTFGMVVTPPFEFSFLLLILPAEASVFPMACGVPTAYNIAFCIATLRSAIESPTTAPGAIATDKTSSDNLSFIVYLLPH